jgi:KDO2-lipid IV(A) lauroyltransferase
MANKKFYRPILYGLMMVLKGFFSLLPFVAAFRFTGFLGRMAFYLIKKERVKTLEHLKIAFPDRSENDLEKLGADVFQNYGYIAAELAFIDKLLPCFDKIISITGRKILDEVVGQDRGGVAIVSHLGNWEFLGGYLAMLGYPSAVIGRRIYYDKYDKMLVGIRNKMKLRTIYRDESPREVLKAIKEKKFVGFVVDQNVETVDGVFAEFFGRPAFTPSAPVRLAMRLDIPVVPLFIIREGMKHHIIIEPSLDLVRTGDTEKDILVNTQKWVTLQENYIRRYPHLWVWNHKRWKTVPKEPILVKN